MAELRSYESRRYSAVLIDDSNTTAVRNVLHALGVTSDRVAAVDVVATNWHVMRVSVPANVNHYPTERAVSSDDGYLHEMYLASLDGSGGRQMLIASPYVKLLHSCLEKIARDRDEKVQFFRPNMEALFSHFERTSEARLSATRISVLMDGDVGLETVSLSGRNPLRSDLRERLIGIASAYAIRVKGTYLSRRGTNIYADRHGNLWWHLSTEPALVNVLAFLNVVEEHGHLSRTTNSPLLRLPDDEGDGQ